MKKPLTTKAAKGLGASAHRRLGYPSPGCVPAEPDSVSPGGRNFTSETIKSRTGRGDWAANIRAAKPASTFLALGIGRVPEGQSPKATGVKRENAVKSRVAIIRVLGDTASAARREVLPTRKTRFSKHCPVETMVGPVAHAIVGYSGGVWPPEQSRHREDWSMSESTTIRYVGLDVHRDSIAIAVAVERMGSRRSRWGRSPTTSRV